MHTVKVIVHLFIHGDTANKKILDNFSFEKQINVAIKEEKVERESSIQAS